MDFYLHVNEQFKYDWSNYYISDSNLNGSESGLTTFQWFRQQRLCVSFLLGKVVEQNLYKGMDRKLLLRLVCSGIVVDTLSPFCF